MSRASQIVSSIVFFSGDLDVVFFAPLLNDSNDVLHLRVGGIADHREHILPIYTSQQSIRNHLDRDNHMPKTIHSTVTPQVIPIPIHIRHADSTDV